MFACRERQAVARYTFRATGYIRRTKIKQNGDTLDEKIGESNLHSIHGLVDRGECFDAPGENDYRIPRHDQPVCRAFTYLRFTGNEEREYVFQGLAELEASVAGNEGEGCCPC